MCLSYKIDTYCRSTLQNRKQPATHHGLPAAGLETGTKKDATLYFAVGLEPTQSYLPLNILNFYPFMETLSIQCKAPNAFEKVFC